jgi:hypothetical protein
MKQQNKTVEEIEKIANTLSKEEQAIFVGLVLGTAVDTIKEKVRTCTDAYIKKKGEIPLGTWRTFYSSKNFEYVTLSAVVKFFIDLQRNPLPPGHRGLKNPD